VVAKFLLIAQAARMTSPLVLLGYERVLPGGQLVHRLQDFGYRIQALSDASKLVEQCQEQKPFLVMVDLAMKTEQVRQAVLGLSQNEATRHIPIIAFAPSSNQELLKPEATPGATLTVNDGDCSRI
jgi:CheY-like chemotaxis protein